MAGNEQREGFKNTRFPRQAPGLLGKILTLALSAALLVVAVTFSLLVFAILAVGGVLVWGYFWWKTRELRKQLRDRPVDARDSGQVIEGEVIRDNANHEETPR